MCYETLKQVQGDKSGLFTRPPRMVTKIKMNEDFFLSLNINLNLSLNLNLNV
jgi:hypothetical protein